MVFDISASFYNCPLSDPPPNPIYYFACIFYLRNLLIISLYTKYCLTFFMIFSSITDIFSSRTVPSPRHLHPHDSCKHFRHDVIVITMNSYTRSVTNAIVSPIASIALSVL